MKAIHYRRIITACGINISDSMATSSYYSAVTCKNCIRKVEKETRLLEAGNVPGIPELDSTPAEPVAEETVPVPATVPAHETREAWLIAAVKEINEAFFTGETIPATRVSVGWAGGKGKKGLVKFIGQCWGNSALTDGVPQMFVSPALSAPVQILETLVHEMCHAIDDCKSGHRGNFKRLAVKAGLEGKMTATHAGKVCREKLEEIAEKLGHFPHAALKPNTETKKGNKNRHLKMSCQHCEYTARSSRGAMEEFGMPSHCGEEMYEV